MKEIMYDEERNKIIRLRSWWYWKKYFFGYNVRQFKRVMGWYVLRLYYFRQCRVCVKDFNCHRPFFYWFEQKPFTPCIYITKKTQNPNRAK